MSANFNILVTSISRKVPLVKAVRQSLDNLNLKGKLYGGDSNPNCIARYFVDEFWLMPLQNVLSIEDFLEYCKTHKIKAIIPTRDGELAFFSKHMKLLSNNGISCMISKEKAIETCSNKLLFYQFLSSLKLPAIPTSTKINLIPDASYVVKECFGAGSQAIGLRLDSFQASLWSENLKNPIFQPFIEGKEYSVDVYITRQNSPHGAIVRTRELIVDGESQITASAIHAGMEAICLEAAVHLGIYGHAVFQIIGDSNNQLHVIECNARFGGASTLSIAMGLHSFEWFILESLQRTLPPFVRSSKEMRQIRYPEDKVFSL